MYYYVLIVMIYYILSFQDLGRRNAKLNNYYENFRRDMISILGNIKMPAASGSSTSVDLAAPIVASSASSTSQTATESSVSTASHISKENFDSYFSKLQTICTDSMSEADVKPMCDQVKSAIQSNFTSTAAAAAAAAAVMPTSI